MGIFDEQRRRAKVYAARRYLARLIDGLALGFITAPIWVGVCTNFERETVIHAVAVTVEIVWRLVTDGWNGARTAAIDGAHSYWAGLVQVIAVALALVVAVMTLYEWLTHAWFGRSLGKALVGIKVIQPEFSLGTGSDATRQRLAISSACWGDNVVTRIRLGAIGRRVVLTRSSHRPGWCRPGPQLLD